MSKNEFLVVLIKGKQWRVYIQTHTAYKRKHGKDSYAIVYPEDREIWFDKSNLKLSLIRHEVFHSFQWSTDTEHTAELSVSDTEEISCTIYGNNSKEIENVVDQIVDYALKCV